MMRAERGAAAALSPALLAAGVWPVLALGVSMGLIAVADPWIRAGLLRFGLGAVVPRLLPALGAAAVAAVGLVAAGVWAWRKTLFAHRDRGLLAAFLVSLLFTGLNLDILDPTDVTVLALLYVWFLMLFAERRRLVLPLPYMLLVLGLAFFSLASIVNGLGLSLLKQHTLLSKLALFVVLINVLRTEKDLEFACRLVVRLGVAAALLALAQVLVFALTGVPITFDDLPKFWFKQTALGPVLRASALFATPQNLAHFLAFATALNLFLTPRRVWRAAATFLMGAAVALTWSLGGWIVWTGVVAAWPLLARPRWALQYTVALGLGLAVASPAAGAAGLDYRAIVAVAEDSGADRVTLLRAAVEMIHRHPFLGCGLANHGRLAIAPVHNAYLQLASEIGVPGGLIFAALVALVIGGALAAAVRGGPGRAAPLAKGLFLGVSALGAHFLTEPFANNVISWSFLGLAAAASLALRRRAPGLALTQAR